MSVACNAIKKLLVYRQRVQTELTLTRAACQRISQLLPLDNSNFRNKQHAVVYFNNFFNIFQRLELKLKIYQMV